MPALITTVLPTYRRPEFLRRALRSVLAQTFQDFVVCVYDNASGDETADVVAAFASRDSRVRYYCHSQNIGPVANYNYGIHQVATPYFSLLPDDDVLMPEFYEKSIEAFNRYPAAGCFCARVVVYEALDRRLRHNQSTTWRSGYYEASTDNVLHELADHLQMTGIVFKAEVRNTVGAFELASDVLYLAEVFSTYPFVVGDFYGAIYTVHPSSATVRGRQPGPVSDRNLDGRADRREVSLFILNKLLNLDGKDVSDRFRLFTGVYNLTGDILSGHAAIALAEGRLPDFDADLHELRFVRIPIKRRMALSCAQYLSRVAPRLAVFLMGHIVNRPRTSQSARDQQIMAYLASLEAPFEPSCLR